MTVAEAITGDEITASLRQFADARITETHVRAAMEREIPDLGLYQDLTRSLGLADLFLPAWLEGYEIDLPAAAAVFDCLGQRLAWGPFLTTFGHAVPLLAALGPSEAATDLLDRVRGGESLIVLTSPSFEIRDDTVAPGDRVTVTGRARNVLSAPEVTTALVLAAAPGGRSTVIVVDLDEPGVTVEPVGCLDLTRRLGDVTLATVGQVVAPEIPPTWTRIVGRASLLHAAASLGACRHLLEITADHARTRLQFGQPIGSFQAVKHRCARMLVEIRLAEAAIDQAAQQWPHDWEQRVATAVITVRHTASVVASNALQVLGGIGFTWEHSAHLYAKRLVTDRQLLDDLPAHRRLISEAIGG